MSAPYDLRTAPPARRAIADTLPPDIAVAAVELVTGPLLGPHRVGHELGEELTGIHSARLGRLWRVLYEIDDVARVVTVLDVQHRSAAYRRR